MVATTFAADTPLFVTELVAEDGIAGNWMWWSMAFGGVLTVFFFADLWQKSGVLTDVELCEMRYDGPAAPILRAVKAVYFGIVMNILVCGWVSLGMESVVRTLIPELPFPPIVFVAILMFITAIFSTMAGLTGVTITDSFQFVIAITGSIVLAAYAIQSVGGLNELVQRYDDLGDSQALDMVIQLGETKPAAKFYNFRCNSVPYDVPCNVTATTKDVHHGFQLVHNDAYYTRQNCASGTCTSIVVAKPGSAEGQQYSKVFSTGPKGEAYACSVGMDKAVLCEETMQHDFCNCAIDSSTGTVQMWMSEIDLDFISVLQMTAAQFFAYVGIMWWSSWYPGVEPGGGGYIAQRMMSCKDEKHAVYATLWYITAHYCLRPWPWILTALVAHLLYPDLEDPRDGFTLVMREVLPDGARGLLFAAFLGAYMSTISTQFNWGVSYIVNDLLKRFLLKVCGAALPVTPPTSHHLSYHPPSHHLSPPITPPPTTSHPPSPPPLIRTVTSVRMYSTVA
jgi:hypothetical protein